MKAVQISTYGGTDVLGVKTDVPEPTPAAGQILVEVHAAGLNPFDSKMRSGVYKDMIPLQFPLVPGGDYAGKVARLGEGVTQFKVGDKVYGTAIVLSGGSGAYAQFAVAGAATSAHRPETISCEETAGLPVAGVSAVQAIEEHMLLKAGQKILIHGGAGGIGHMAIQLAKSIGAYVATTVSGDDKEFVQGLGADEVIDYKAQKFEEILHDYDAVFDTVGGEVTNKSFSVLKKGGILLSMTGKPDSALAAQHGVTGIGQQTKNDTEHLKRLAQLIDEGKMKVHIAKVFPIDQVKEAFDLLNDGHPRGKVVLKVNS